MSCATHFVGTADRPQYADPPGQRSALPGHANIGLSSKVRPCCAIAGEASNAAMAATDKIAFMFNLLFGIVGGGGFLSTSRALTNEHSSRCPLAKVIHQETRRVCRRVY